MAQMRLAVAVLGGMAGLVVGMGEVVTAQIANNPYKVNYNWDKLEGRKIGVASGIRPTPDGRHLWILDRCGANGCAESPLDPIIQVDMEAKETSGSPTGRPRAIPAARPASRRASATRSTSSLPTARC
jgi:hypothetical protein